MTEIVLTMIGILGTLSSIFFAYLAFKRNSNLEHQKVGKNEGMVNSNMEHIKSTLDRMENKLDSVEDKYHELVTRVVRVEERTDKKKRKGRWIERWNLRVYLLL